MKPDPFWARVATWLRELLNGADVDLVVTVERKATALMRAFLESAWATGLQLGWREVLSSDALPFLPPNWLDGRRVLVFNEMIHHGDTTSKTLAAIRLNSPRVHSIAVAACIVHKDFNPQRRAPALADLIGEPHEAMYRSVTDRTYKLVRDRIVDILRESGSLLLDTEHIESTFTASLPFREIVHGMAAVGRVVEYEADSSDMPAGVTVRVPFVGTHEKLRAMLPAGADIDAEEPKKIRIVRRPGPRHYALLPIWYPLLPVAAADSFGLDEHTPAYVRRALRECPGQERPRLAFHLSGLIASIELLRSTWALLHDLERKGLTPDTPSAAESTDAPLGHLRALYPLLDFKGLEAAVSSALATRNDADTVRLFRDARGWKRSQKNVAPVVRIDAVTRRRECYRLLLECLRERESFGIDEDLAIEELDDSASMGWFTWSDFWAAGDRLGIPEDVRSIAMDTAIDEGILTTKEAIITRADQEFIVRAYELDGELTLQELLRMAHGGVSVRSA